MTTADVSAVGGLLQTVNSVNPEPPNARSHNLFNETLVDGWGAKVGPERENCDHDGDGVPDDRDQCPNTPAGAVVNARAAHRATVRV